MVRVAGGLGERTNPVLGRKPITELVHFRGGGRVQKLICSSFNFYIISTLKLYGQERIIVLKEKLVSK